MNARIPTCHPARKHCANGLCHTCYYASYNAARCVTRLRVKSTPTCGHAERPHPAKGLCALCYHASYNAARCARYVSHPKVKPIVTCGHPERNHHAKGMCHPCFNAAYNAVHREEIAAQQVAGMWNIKKRLVLGKLSAGPLIRKRSQPTWLLGSVLIPNRYAFIPTAAAHVRPGMVDLTQPSKYRSCAGRQLGAASIVERF